VQQSDGHDANTQSQPAFLQRRTPTHQVSNQTAYPSLN
jgi:hypothetical protein